jgi:hypothetical protein
MPLPWHEDGYEKVRVKYLYCNDIHARCLTVILLARTSQGCCVICYTAKLSPLLCTGIAK